ncbi:MAG: O-antigen ligase family protein [Candidatus Goldiibacteriota bacterium]
MTAIFDFFRKTDALISGFINLRLLSVFKKTENSKTYSLLQKISSFSSGHTIAFLTVSAFAFWAAVVFLGFKSAVIILPAVFLLSAVNPLYGIFSFIVLFMFDLPNDIASGLTVHSAETAVLFIAAGMLIHLLVFGAEKNSAYTGISIFLAIIIFSFLPLLYVPEKKAVLKGLIRICEPVVFFAAVSLFFKKENCLKILSLGFTLSIIPFLSVSLYHFLYTRELLTFVRLAENFFLFRPSGGMGVTALPAYLNIIFPVSLIGVILFSRGSRSPGFLLFLSALIPAVMFAVPSSRAGWVVFFIFLAAFIPLLFIKKSPLAAYKKPFIIILISSAVLGFFLINIISEGRGFDAFKYRVHDSVTPGTSSAESAMNRVGFITLGLKIIKENPFGIGPGNYHSKLASYIDSGSIDRAAFHHLHNLHLQIAVEYGLHVYLAALILFLYLFFLLIQKMRSSPAPENKSICILFMLCLGVFFIQGFFDVFTVFARGAQYGIIFGMIAGYLNKNG